MMMIMRAMTPTRPLIAATSRHYFAPPQCWPQIALRARHVFYAPFRRRHRLTPQGVTPSHARRAGSHRVRLRHASSSSGDDKEPRRQSGHMPLAYGANIRADDRRRHFDQAS